MPWMMHVYNQAAIKFLFCTKINKAPVEKSHPPTLPRDYVSMPLIIVEDTIYVLDLTATDK